MSTCTALPRALLDLPAFPPRVGDKLDVLHARGDERPVVRAPRDVQNLLPVSLVRRQQRLSVGVQVGS